MGIFKDYSNAVIYGFICKDRSVKDHYIGSTADFWNREEEHRKACNCLTSNSHFLRVYKFIRAHGGWDNWDMVVIEHYPCTIKEELLERESFYIKYLNATLNVSNPFGRMTASKLEYMRKYGPEICDAMLSTECDDIPHPIIAEICRYAFQMYPDSCYTKWE